MPGPDPEFWCPGCEVRFFVPAGSQTAAEGPLCTCGRLERMLPVTPGTAAETVHSVSDGEHGGAGRA